MFEAYITNTALYPLMGIEVGTTVHFPTTTQELQAALAKIGIDGKRYSEVFFVLLSQAQGDRQILAKQLGISPHQLSYVTHTNSGEGLLFFGNTTIPFVDRFPQNTELYAIMTTRPEDKKQEMNRA